MFKNLFKNIGFFDVFWLNSGVKKGIWGQNGKMGDVLTIKGQTVEIPLQSHGNMKPFSSFVPIFHLSLPSIWQAHPYKNFILEINKDRSITSQSLES